jgi:hypothetical protein
MKQTTNFKYHIGDIVYYAYGDLDSACEIVGLGKYGGHDGIPLTYEIRDLRVIGGLDYIARDV